MAIAILTIKLDITKFKVKCLLEMNNEETIVQIDSVYIGKEDVFEFLSKHTVKALYKEIKKKIC